MDERALPGAGHPGDDAQHAEREVDVDVLQVVLGGAADLQRAGGLPDGLLQRGAVVQVFEPYADRLVSEGRGHVWHRFSERGDIAYTTFYATRRFTRARREAALRLVRKYGDPVLRSRARPVETFDAALVDVAKVVSAFGVESKERGPQRPRVEAHTSGSITFDVDSSRCKEADACALETS